MKYFVLARRFGARLSNLAPGLNFDRNGMGFAFVARATFD